MLNTPNKGMEPGRAGAPKPQVRPRSADFRFVDLCAGIGGFHLGLARLGGRCVLAADIDPAARRIYHEAFPATPLVDDVWQLAADPLERVPAHDLLAAGLPCQPFSSNGKAPGLADSRAHVFFGVLAIVIAHRPRWVALENVPRLISRQHRPAFELMAASLRAIGYRVPDEPMLLSPHELPAAVGGTAQRRYRVFLTAERADLADITVPLTPSFDQALTSRMPRLADVLDGQPSPGASAAAALTEQEVGWIDAWNDLVRGLGPNLPPGALWADAMQAVVPAAVQRGWNTADLARSHAFYLAHRAVVDRWRHRWRVDDFPAYRRRLVWRAGRGPYDLWRLIVVLRMSGVEACAPQLVPTLLTERYPVIGWQRRRLTPREAARLQGFPDTHPLPDPKTTAYRLVGNAVHPAVVTAVARALLRRDDALLLAA